MLRVADLLTNQNVNVLDSAPVPHPIPQKNPIHIWETFKLAFSSCNSFVIQSSLLLQI